MDDPTRGIEASQERDDKDKREHRREKREERRQKREEGREKREETREKREEVPKEAARGPQMRPQEVPKEVPRGLLASWRPDRVRGRDGEERVRSLDGGGMKTPETVSQGFLFLRGVRDRGCFPRIA